MRGRAFRSGSRPPGGARWRHRALVESVLDDARALGLKQVFGLTRKPIFFLRLGFRAAAVTRQEFIPTSGGVVGFAIVHSKLIVIDPFTRPVVITGSHNFSGAASTKNDENFLIIRDNKELALEYGAHILSVYHHYRWLAYLNDMQRKGKKPQNPMHEDDSWQGYQLKGGARKEMDFWLR